MLNRIFLFAVLFLGMAFSFQQDKSKVLSKEEFSKGIQRKEAQLIDVRTPDEFKAGHIAHAKNIDYLDGNFKKEISKLDKQKPVYIYCQSGGRSAKAAAVLAEAGFKEIYDLKGGYSTWGK